MPGASVRDGILQPSSELTPKDHTTAGRKKLGGYHARRRTRCCAAIWFAGATAVIHQLKTGHNGHELALAEGTRGAASPRSLRPLHSQQDRTDRLEADDQWRTVPYQIRRNSLELGLASKGRPTYENYVLTVARPLRPRPGRPRLRWIVKFGRPRVGSNAHVSGCRFEVLPELKGFFARIRRRATNCATRCLVPRSHYRFPNSGRSERIRPCRIGRTCGAENADSINWTHLSKNSCEGAILQHSELKTQMEPST